MNSLFFPFLILSILCLLILPLPTFVLDLFFTFNIIFSIIILIVSIFVVKILDFSSFPTILLFSTLFRLSLNISSTRIILLNGHTGSCSAGHVIESFGFFLIRGNFFIGIIIFIMLVIINFSVISNGSSRIAEVGARFILDAMPGKQMAIDADLNSGLISEKQAKKRRLEIHKEAEFYGSMDGASKFIRGDAIAGIIIMIVNVIGGLLIGIVQYKMSLLKAIKIYSILTIGDGLVSQIPSLIISIASGIILTRSNSDKINIGEKIIYQVFNNSKVIFFSSIIFCFFGLIPGMPNFIFLFFSVLFFILSWYINYRKNINKNFSKILKFKKRKKIDISWNDIEFEDLLRIELSSIFFKLCYQKEYNNLIKKLQFLRKNIAQDYGFLLPEINIIHNSKLDRGQYKIFIKGVELFSGFIFFDKLLIINKERDLINISGIKITDSFFSFPVFWINPVIKDTLLNKKIVFLDSNVLIIKNFNKIIRNNLYNLFGFQETQQLLDRISQHYPKLIDYLIPNLMSIITFQNILQNLLKDDISIKDIRTIVETLIKYSSQFKNNIEELTNIIRIALKEFITQKFFFKNKYINVIGLSTNFENILLKFVGNNKNQIEPIFSEKLIEKTKSAIILQKKNNLPVVLLVNPKIRVLLSNFFLNCNIILPVLSFSEISENRVIKITQFIDK
ncbi:flagellar biosynthesis protein FlhA [Buchnera aphidicola]|uniref:flagellar biosynthesis protein FlhA n=1 Tax=Buchnera aphidicola TaxID=9 RepID=UPI001F265B02|nr:flagellar biosynthesis protein FlhA [Buchnera aphidicola]